MGRCVAILYEGQSPFISSYTREADRLAAPQSSHITPPDDNLRGPNGADTTFNPGAFSPSGGPLQLSFPNFVHPLAPWLRAGLNEIGLPNATDFSSGELNGTAFAPATIAPTDESRSSSAASFLAAAQGRPNLVVFQNTMAFKLVFDGNRSTGVEVSPLNGSVLAEATTINANREVIISAGAFQSPQLLMLSVCLFRLGTNSQCLTAFHGRALGHQIN